MLSRDTYQEISVDQLFDGDWTKYEEELKTVYYTTLKEVMRTVRINILKEKTSLLKTKKHVLAIWIEKNEYQFASYETMSEEERSELEETNRPKKERAEDVLRRI